MRHLRLPNQSIKNVSTFNAQIGTILNELNKFGQDEENASPTRNDTKPSCSKEESRPLKKRKPHRNKLKPIHALPTVKRFVYKCNVCKITEKNRKCMLKHLDTHLGTPISCLKCKQSFNGRISFKWHLIYCYKYDKLQQKSKYKCSQCSREFISKRNLDSHLQGHKRNNCTYCDKVITKRIHLIRHLLEVHKIKLERNTYNCQYCEKRYIKKTSLFYHLTQHVPEKFVCLECGHFSDTLEENEQHKTGHDSKKLFKCQRCGEKFARRQQYQFHLKRHNQYKCVTCNEQYASRAKVMKHKRQGHAIEGIYPRFICPHCPVAFHRENKLVFHLRKHNDDNRTINCKYCKKSFTSPYGYYKHCITISHEKFSPDITNLVCEHCGKNFTKKYDLKQHMYRVHNTTRKLNNCTHCNYKTFNKCNMDRHVALHFRSQEFTCEHCGKIFSSIATLKDHISYNHLQEKQFKCEQCGKLFKRNSELIRHRDTHSDYRPHVCTSCGKTYKRVTHLRRHQQNVHHIAPTTRRIKRINDDDDDDDDDDKTNDEIVVHDNILLNLETNDALNIVDQLVSTFLPDDNDEFYSVYDDLNDVQL